MTEINLFYDWCEKLKKWIPFSDTQAVQDKFFETEAENKPISFKEKQQTIKDRRDRLSPFQMKLQ